MPLPGAVRLLIYFLSSHRILLYCVLSFLAVVIEIATALRNYSNFYSVSISLSKSSRSVLLLSNFILILALFCGHIVQRIFFGTLRPNEVERLYDRLWFFITESLLAFTIFRNEFDIHFAAMFGFLLFVKSFHWLASDRIEWMDQRPYPGPSLLFHIRMVTLFVILWITDFLMFFLAVESTLTHGVGGMVLFASEYGILLASAMNTMCKYLLSAYELRRAGRRGGENAPAWENKSMLVFYIELATDFLKLSTYLIFFIVIITFYGLPLNIVRDVYITARSFISRLQALHRYQTATRNMDERYPNATPEELAAMNDSTCIICREEMVIPEERQAPASDGPNMTPKRLPCGHVFHFHCLRSWLERQQSCPTCRRNVLDNANPGEQHGNAAGVPPAPDANANNVFGGAQNANPNLQAGNNIFHNPFNNPLGFVGRLFGPQGNANPFAHPRVDAAAHPQPAPATAQLPGQIPPGVVIQYHIQYQFPQGQQRQQRQQQQMQSQRVLRPLPEFPGFPGPGGVWRQWLDRGDGHRREETAAETNVSGPSRSIPTPATTTTTPTPPTTTNAPTNDIAEEGAAASPREAAVAAAMRRMQREGSSRPMATTSGSDGSASISSAHITSSNPSPASTHPSVDIPRLIPLYDYSAYTTMTAPSRPAESRTVPERVTDAQLGVLDKLTREAIDERLRILEGVSGVVYRCIEDLMKVRSVLPPAPDVVNPPVAGGSTSTPSPAPATPGEKQENGGDVGMSPKAASKRREETPVSPEEGLREERQAL